MTWAQRFWLRLETLFRRNRSSHRLDDEIEFHLDQQIGENLAAGMSPEEARHAAKRAFGNPTFLKEETRDTWGLLWVEQIMRNVRHSARSLLRTPGFAVSSILVIALGIAATTSLFAVVDSVLLEPLPFKDPSRLTRLYENTTDKFPYNAIAGGVFTAWEKRRHSFSDLAVLKWAEYNLSGSSGQLPEKVVATQCSWNLFPTLGVAPALGRGFSEVDDQPSANATVILSWGLWKRRFGGDGSILNQNIHLDAKPYTVIGVMPAWFTFPAERMQLWTPIHHEQLPEKWQQLANHMFEAIGRLEPGVTEAQATAELSLIVHGLHDEHRDNPFISTGANSRPLLEHMVRDVKTPLYALLGATGCLFLIACLNVASLLVARGAARRRELAIRAALGGSRWRLLGERVTESGILSLAGGAVGLLLAYSAIGWFITTRPDMSRVEAIHINGMVLAFAAGLVCLCSLFAGMTSWLSIKGRQIFSLLQESSRLFSAGHGRVHLRRGLLSLEVGLTVVLLIGAGLLLKSYVRLRSSNLGCITNNVLTMSISLPQAKYGTPVQRVNFFETLLTRVRSVAGVQAAGLVTAVPGQGYWWDSGFTVAEHPPLPLGKSLFAIVRVADPGYFTTLGIPLLRGQNFDANRWRKQVDEAIISESFARKFFGEEDPIGKHLRFEDGVYKIVGIVGDTRFLISEPEQPIMYFSSCCGGTLAVRSTRDVDSLALPIQRIVRQLDPDLPVSNVLTMDQMIGKSTLDASFDATLVLAFALLSLLLAAVGLFGVLSYIVSQRTTELGIRIALGAQQSEVLRLTLSDGLRPAGVGLVFGIAGGAAATRTFTSLLYGVQPLDATVFAAVAILLLVVAGVACLLPAWRASRLDPMQALRSE